MAARQSGRAHVWGDCEGEMILAKVAVLGTALCLAACGGGEEPAKSQSTDTGTSNEARKPVPEQKTHGEPGPTEGPDGLPQGQSSVAPIIESKSSK